MIADIVDNVPEKYIVLFEKILFNYFLMEKKIFRYSYFEYEYLTHIFLIN